VRQGGAAADNEETLAELVDLSQPDRTVTAPPAACALLRLGFRPFYLLASLFAALSIALWGAQYAGVVATPHSGVPAWHAHEMIFGFTLAVMTGFLFTAVRNWTSRPTPTGPLLGAIALLWIAGRVCALLPYPVASAAIDTLFPLVVAGAVAVPLFAKRDRRNVFFVALLIALAAADLAMHLARLGVVPWHELAPAQVALDILLLVMTVLGGRVIPMFTRNSVRTARVRGSAWLERAVPALLVAILLADLFAAPAWLLAILLALGAAAQALRLWLWDPLRTLRVPMVWILHVGYLWIAAHLALRALSMVDLVAAPLATHALTVGAIGALTLGMMTRTARGHTGRPIVADASEIAMFALVIAAALARVLVPIAVPDAYREAVIASACFWSAAYAVYAIRYWPVLTRPRIDGKPG
jgi:uncharacterized protein involved in response to NO